MSKSKKIWLVITASLLLIGSIIFVGSMTIMNWDFTKLSTAEMENNSYLIEDAYLSIYVKADTADTVKLTVTTGDIRISNVNCRGDVQAFVFTGDISVEDVECENLVSNGSTGDLGMQNVIASGKFTLERTTGDIKFDNCDAAEISARTTTGDVTGTLCTEKLFKAKASTGRVDVPDTITGGLCRIDTTTGDILLQIG